MSGLAARPATIHDVSRRVAAGGQPFDMALREFLDCFYLEPLRRAAAIEQAPLPLTPFRDAYLAATAEHLAETHGLAIPAWAETAGLDLQKPFFAGGLESLKALLLVQSPTAFRRRMLFVSKDALFRPRS